ncbi:MAG: hypothetical protein WC107_02400 [Patescibacteria group bacterium]
MFFANEQAPFYLIGRVGQNLTELLACDSALFVFTSEEKADSFIVTNKLDGHIMEMSWRQIVKKYGQRFDRAIIDPNSIIIWRRGVINYLPLVEAAPPESYAYHYCRPTDRRWCLHAIKMAGQICCCRDMMPETLLLQYAEGEERTKNCGGWPVRTDERRMP